MKADKKKEIRARDAARPSAIKSLVIDLNDQLQSFINALKAASSEDGRN